jgi:hypothetical protein
VTEAEWLAPGDLARRLRWLHRRVPARTLRLFALACCRRIWHLLGPVEPRAVEAAERFLDREIAARVLAVHAKRIRRIGPGSQAVRWACLPTGAIVTGALACMVQARIAATCPGGLPKGLTVDLEHLPEAAAQETLLRDIVGNPFRPLALAPGCRTPDVLKLVRAIYAERAFERLPVLADALEEAGCTDAELLGHLRGPGPHVLGCFALELLVQNG